MIHEIAALGPWFHNLHLPDGSQTAPDHAFGDFPAWKWQQLAAHLPQDLQGWRALDIGCNAGFYSFALARRGARVTAIDADPHYLRQARWAVRQFGLTDSVEFRQQQIHDLARSPERYDLILFMGVFYHLRYPLLALDTVATLEPRLLVFQTLTAGGEKVSPASAGDIGFDVRERLSEPGWPNMAFIEHCFAGDPTNWWVPNHAAVLALLRSARFEVAARPGHEIYLCHPSGMAPPEWVRSEWLAASAGERGKEMTGGAR